VQLELQHELFDRNAFNRLELSSKLELLDVDAAYCFFLFRCVVWFSVVCSSSGIFCGILAISPRWNKLIFL